MDNFLSVTGTLYVIVKYQKDKVRHLHGFDVRTAETLEEHRQAIQEWNNQATSIRVRTWIFNRE